VNLRVYDGRISKKSPFKESNASCLNRQQSFPIFYKIKIGKNPNFYLGHPQVVKRLKRIIENGNWIYRDALARALFQLYGMLFAPAFVCKVPITTQELKNCVFSETTNS